MDGPRSNEPPSSSVLGWTTPPSGPIYPKTVTPKPARTKTGPVDRLYMTAKTRPPGLLMAAITPSCGDGDMPVWG